MRRSILTMVVVTAVLASPGGVAVAGDEPGAGGEPPVEQPGVPEDTGGQWVPWPPEAYQPVEVAACGSTVTVTPGDVRATEYRARAFDDGTTVVRIRGGGTVDVVRTSDGAVLDELDVAGSGYEFHRPELREVIYDFDGPALIGALDEVERAAFAAEGLPELFYYSTGRVIEQIALSADPQAESIESAQVLAVDAEVHDVCAMLDAAAAAAAAEAGTVEDLPRPSVQQTVTAASEAGTARPAACPPEQLCQVSPTMYDVDADGRYDPYVADTNGNQFLDQNIILSGGVLVWLFDGAVEDQIPDAYGGDTNADGVPDFWMRDPNQDGVLDDVVMDPAVHGPRTGSVQAPAGGTTINIGFDIPIDVPGLQGAVTGLLQPGARTSSNFCTFVNSAALLGSGLTCVYG